MICVFLRGVVQSSSNVGILPDVKEFCTDCDVFCHPSVDHHRVFYSTQSISVIDVIVPL